MPVHSEPQEVNMFEQLTARMEFFSNALQLRAYRQQLLASNIANADTTGYTARDFDFQSALKNATGARGAEPLSGRQTLGLSGDSGLHLNTVSSKDGVLDKVKVAYTRQTQPSLDGNTVDMDQQRANFVDNSIQYESTLRFINGHVKTMLSAIQGQ